MRQKGFVHIILLLIVILIVGVGAFIFVRSGKNPLSSIGINVGTPLPDTNNDTFSQGDLFSGKLTRLDQNLGIFKITEDQNLNGITGGFIYYSAGKFVRGSLVGYTRIVATEPPMGPGSAVVFILATKDFKTYVLDNSEDNGTQDPFVFLDKSKVISSQKFDTELPKEVDLDKNYSLYEEEFAISSVDSGNKDKFGQAVYESRLTDDFSLYKNLHSPSTNLNFYFLPYTNKDLTSDTNTQALKEKYLSGLTHIVVVDSTGLPVWYALTTKNNINKYNSDLAQYEIDQKKYEADVQKYNNKEISDYPVSPAYVYLPNLGFKSFDIKNAGGTNFYNSYAFSFPNACANSLNASVVDNISDTDLEQVGTVNGLNLFALRDKSHEINALEYESKVGAYNDEEFSQVNKGQTKPTISEYENKNPLLFVKDYWGRWVALGEYDINLLGGCGKPVVYLYPKMATKVTISFNTSVKFTTDIPTYGNYWQVLAQPNGVLTNLRPELTDCNDLSYSHFGSEYAREACLTNTYPYLYWSGNVLSQNYEEPTGGWIVDRQKLNGFVDNKLTEIGLNSVEKQDFLSYWIPKMLTKDARYYKISFLSTNELNTLFPMTVVPVPDTVYRIFLDYRPLDSLPETPLVPQKLPKLVRNGFTLVEWGGLNL